MGSSTPHESRFRFYGRLKCKSVIILLASCSLCALEQMRHIYNMEWSKVLKGCGMGPWLVLVSPCFRENVVATCKIGSFLCSLDNLLQKEVIVLFFLNQISKWCSFHKKGYF